MYHEKYKDPGRYKEFDSFPPLESVDELLWEGKPSMLRIATQHQFDIAIDFKAVMIVLIVLVQILILVFSGLSWYGKGVLMTIVTFYLYGKYVNIRETNYLVTKQGVYIRSRFWLFRKTHFIPYTSIDKVWVERFHDNSATIYFMPKYLEKLPRTRHLFTGAQRHYPTFELISGAEEVVNIINAAMEENRQLNTPK